MLTFSNLGLVADWNTPVVIDWGDAARGDPLADVARTDLLHRVSEPPPGTSWFLQALIPIGRGILANRYVSTYRRRRGIDEAQLEHWKLVRAAARLDEGIDAEPDHYSATCASRCLRMTSDLAGLPFVDISSRPALRSPIACG